MTQAFLTPNLGKQEMGKTPINTRTVYVYLVVGKSIINADITATTAFPSGYAEASWATYARQSVTAVAIDSTGKWQIPGTTWAGASDAAANVSGFGYATALTAGISLGHWDFKRTGTTSSGSAVVTSMSETANLNIGDTVWGSGIQASTTILTIDSSSQITLNKTATASASGVVLAVTHPLNSSSAQLVIPTNNVFFQDAP